MFHLFALGLLYLAPLKFEDAMRPIEELEPLMLLGAVQQQSKLYLVYGEFNQRPVIRFVGYDGETGQVIFYDDPALGNLRGARLVPWGEHFMLLYSKNGVQPKAIVISADQKIIETYRLGNWQGFKDTYMPAYATVDGDRILMTVREVGFTPQSPDRYLLLAFYPNQESIEILHQNESPVEPLYWLPGEQGFFEMYPYTGRIDSLSKTFEKISALKPSDQLISKESNRIAAFRNSFRKGLASFPFKYHTYFDFPFLIEDRYSFRGAHLQDNEIRDIYSTLSLAGDFNQQSDGQLLGVFEDHKIIFDFSMRTFIKVKNP